MQEIKFLEFMGGSNLLQASSNYLICMSLMRISMVLQADKRTDQSSTKVHMFLSRRTAEVGEKLAIVCYGVKTDVG